MNCSPLETPMSKCRVVVSAIIPHLMWSSAFLFGKTALSVLPPLSIAGLRLVIATLLLVVIVHRNPLPYMQGKWKWVLLISFLSTYVNFSVFNLGLSLVPGSLGSMIIGVSPAFTSLAAVLILKEKMTRKKTACLCLGMTGVVLLALSRSPWNSTGLSEILGIVLLLCSNSANAVSTSIMKKHFSKDEVMPLTLVHTSIGAVAVCLTAFALENPDYSQFYNPDAFGSIFCLAIITAGATTIWNALLCQRGVHVTDLAIWRFLIPSAGAALSWLFLPNDNPSFVMICCLVLITSSILLSVIEFPRCELICKSKGVAIGDNK